MCSQVRTAEQVLAAIAGSQYGVATRDELVEAGLTARQIDDRARRGSLIRQHRGVYRVGHAGPSIEARYLAAVKAAGPGAVLSGRAAAYVLGLLRGPAPPPEVTAPTERRVKGVRTRRARSLDRREVTTYRGSLITTVPRTLVDLAAVLTADELALACHEAGVRYRTTPRQVEAVLKRLPNSRGARRLRQVMSGDIHVALSKLEKRFLRLLRELGLPLPTTNIVVSRRRVDCRWFEYRLTVELDSYQFHNSRYSWEQDRKREREAYARGDQFRRYTWSDVFEDPSAMLRELRALLGQPAAARP